MRTNCLLDRQHVLDQRVREGHTTALDVLQALQGTLTVHDTTLRVLDEVLEVLKDSVVTMTRPPGDLETHVRELEVRELGVRQELEAKDLEVQGLPTWT